MAWDRIKMNWKHLKGRAKEQWRELTDEQLDRIAGRREHLAGALQKNYGIRKDEAERQLQAFEERYRDFNPGRML